MAEGDIEFELEGFKKHLGSLFDSFLREELGPESDIYCERFCKLVEECTGRWQEPLPQLRFLQTALCSLVQASLCFPADCEHVQCTLSSLALSAFELLLFFGQSDILRNPLKDIVDSLWECCSSFGRHQNAHLLQLMQVIREGGPWANTTLHAILTEQELPQDEVDKYLGSEMPVFLELRVRYLMAKQKGCEATALAKTCAQHSTLGQHLFFLQVYLTFLWKASHHDHLHKVIAEADGKDAVDIICYMDNEHDDDDDDDELVLSLCRAFLSEQLRRGDMYYMWQLVFIWSKLQLRVNPSKQALLEQSRQLMLSSTNVKSVFPFMGVIVAEMGKEALQFCVELCTHALQSELPSDPSTKSLIYKTIAYLLPSDLEVCRACALLVFFVERSLDAYKTVFLLYTHPDQEYNSEAGPVGNHIRFEILQVLKRGLYFDPEFWNLMALRTNCLKLMSEKVGNAALVDIMEEEKWLPSYCTKESVCCLVTTSTSNQLPSKPPTNHQTTSKKRLHKGDKNHTNKRVKTRPEKKEETELSVNHAVKRRGKKPGLPPVRDASCVSSLRRSFRQLDSSPENLARSFVDRQHRHMTRLSEKKPPKRKIRKPRWLQEEEATQAENSALRKGKKPGKKPQQQKQLRTTGGSRKSEPGLVKNNTKQKTTEISSCLEEEELQTICQKELTTKDSWTSSLDQSLELSQPDNDISASFIEDMDHTQKSPEPPCGKVPVSPMQTKAPSNNEVTIRACDPCSFIQKMHSYIQRSKVKCATPVKDNQASDLETTVTCSSDHRRPLASVVLEDKPVVVASQTQISAEVEVPSKLFDGSAMPVGVLWTDETSINRNDRSNETAYFSSSQNVIVHKKERKRSERQETLHNDITSVPNLTNNTDTIAVLQEPSVRKCPDEAVQMTMPTNITVKEEQAIEADQVVSSQTLSYENTVIVKELTDSEEQAFNKSVPAEDQASVLLTEEAKMKVESTDTVSDAPKQPTSGNADTGIIPDRKTLVPHCAKSSYSINQIGEQISSRVTEIKQEPEPTTVSALQDSHDMEPLRNPYDPTQDPEDSHLMHHCSLCNKVFKGKLVVAHSMYHYHLDQCMFCGMVFKNDIMAMMHLSKHIDKLKNSNVPTEGNLRKTHKKVKREHSTRSSSRRCKHKRSTVNVATVTYSDGRKLRSSHKQSSRLVDQNRRPSNRSVHSVNGYLRGKVKKVGSSPKETEGKTSCGQNNHYSDSRDEAEELSTSVRLTREPQRDSTLEQTVDKETASSSSLAMDSGVRAKTRPLSHSKSVDEESEPAATDDTAVAQKDVCCPVKGCIWPPDQRKKRHSLLIHALEAHYGYTEPLELAFRLGNSRCSTCSRVCVSFQHYQDHIERHRAYPRHPCLHHGCGARFQTGLEMRRHTRKHCPLRARCCFSGCTKRFPCLWALNLHERKHYANSSTVKKTKWPKRMQTQKKATKVEQSVCKPKDSLTNNQLKRTKANSKPNGPRKTTAKLTPKHKVRNNFKKTKAMKMSVQPDEKDSTVSSPTSSTTGVEANRLQEMQALPVKNSISTTATNLSTRTRAQPNGLKRTSVENKKEMNNQSGQITTVFSHEDSELKTKDIASPQSPNPDTSTATDPTLTSAEAVLKSDILDGHDTKDASTVHPSKMVEVKEETKQHIDETCAPLDQPCAPLDKPCAPLDKPCALLDKPCAPLDKPCAPLDKPCAPLDKPCAPLDKPCAPLDKPFAPLDQPCAPLDKPFAPLHKVTPSASSSTTTHVIDKLTTNDPFNTNEIAKNDHSQASRKPAAQNLLSILVQPNEGDPSGATGKPKKVKTSVSNIVINVASASTGSKPMVKALDSTVTRLGYRVLNGHSVKGDASSTEADKHKPQPEVNSEAMKRKVAGPYIGKKPYIRPPPTSYLDEKFTTMPKRRKEVSWLSTSSPESGALKKADLAQRQRCAKCFSSFNTPEELQSHLELKKCKSLFGFDSDEESNW